MANEHGGQLAAIKKQFPHIKTWLDLSTGISPWNYPCDVKAADLQPLPDEDLEQACLDSAARYFGAKNIIAGNGAQAFIRHIPAIARQLLGVPPVIFTAERTYNEYATAGMDAGCEVAIFDAASNFPEGAVIILGNPNNPDGAVITEAEAVQLSQKLGDKGLLVIDEAFVDLYPQHSVAHLNLPNLIVLKSFGKFFGLAGLRLGFAVVPKNILALFEKAFGVWSVSSAALLIAEKAYGNSTWIDNQRLRILEMSEKLQTLLQEKTEILTNQGLFITCRSDKDLFTGLANKGIYIRAFSDYENIYRFGLPENDVEFAKLKEALDSF